MTRRLTAREKRLRAKARADARRWLKRYRSRIAAARAEEPVLAAYDRTFAEFDAAIREIERFAKRNARTLVAFAASLRFQDHPSDCDCIRCEAARLEEVLDVTSGAFREIQRRADEIQAASARVAQRLRLEDLERDLSLSPTTTGEKR